MAAAYLLLAALLFRSCSWAEDKKVQPPSFAPDSIVNSANGSSDSLTPNGLATVFGSYLADSTVSVVDVGPGQLPTVSPAYGSESAESSYPAVRFSGASQFPDPQRLASRQGRPVADESGAEPGRPYQPAGRGAGAVLRRRPGRCHSRRRQYDHVDFSGKPGEIIVVYGAGLGPPIHRRSTASFRAQPPPSGCLIDARPAGWATSSEREHSLRRNYPGSAGLYQINLRLPDTILSEDPELRIALGDQMSQSAWYSALCPPPRKRLKLLTIRRV
jgi:hypothetical protein